MSRHLKIARVILDSPLPHLDRLFDYEIPEELNQTCVPGVKVKVKFSGRNLEAWVADVTSMSNHVKKLSPITKVISNYPVLTPEVLAICQIVADKFIGNLNDVLRFAIPPRQAKIEKNHKLIDQESKKIISEKSETFSIDCAVFPPNYLFSQDIHDQIIKIKQLGKQSIILLPNINAVEEFVADLISIDQELRIEILSAEQEPSLRYLSFLNILRNTTDVIVGTRNAVFAPVANLGLMAIFDDADQNYYSQQAPYWNARDVAIWRAELNNAKFIAFGRLVSIAMAQVLNEKKAKLVEISDAKSEKYWSKVLTLDNTSNDPMESSKRFPRKSWEVIKDGLKRGNVLIQVPRLGYSSNLQCSDCRESVRCISCSGPMLIKNKESKPECRWCGQVPTNWYCKYCKSKKFRISVVGQTKTVEELGKVFPGIKIITSGGKSIIRNIESDHSIVVATPGAEPKDSKGYACAVLLDAYLLLGVPSLAASEESLRKWLNVFNLVRSEKDGGEIFITAESTNRIVQSLIKKNTNWLIENEREQRESAGLHPAFTDISVAGDEKQILELVSILRSDAELRILGPRIKEDETVQVVVSSKFPENIIPKIRSEIIKFSAARTKPVRAYVNAYDID